jgi:hypothetical protein
MAVKNPSLWTPPSGEGYIIPSTGDPITTQSGVDILTQSKEELIINPNTYSPKYPGAWTLTTKETTSWTPASGAGYVVNIGNENLETNSDELLITNSGNFLVTNPTYNIPKNPSQWTYTGS